MTISTQYAEPVPYHAHLPATEHARLQTQASAGDRDARQRLALHAQAQTTTFGRVAVETTCGLQSASVDAARVVEEKNLIHQLRKQLR